MSGSEFRVGCWKLFLIRASGSGFMKFKHYGVLGFQVVVEMVVG